MNETQIKILEAAESEVADYGFAGASIRNITQRAGVNVAAINYHFGSKEELIKALFRDRIKPINDYRLESLRKAQERAPDGIVSTEELVDILVRPAVAKMMSKEGRRFVQAIARCMSEPTDFMCDLDEELFKEMFHSFLAAFQKALPEHDSETLLNKMNFIICSMVGFMMHFPRIEQLVGKQMSGEESEILLDQYIDFIATGIGSPVSSYSR